MPASVAKLIEVEMRENGAGVLAPRWLPVLERGRKPRESSTDTKLHLKIYDWMARHNKFESKTEKGRRNEAKAMTWYINKYGTKMWRDFGSKGAFKDLYTKETEKTIKKIDETIRVKLYKVTSELL